VVASLTERLPFVASNGPPVIAKASVSTRRFIAAPSRPVIISLRRTTE
jgi:hypothetical protein